MSYANGTPFLNLAQTIGTDHRDWFDENEAKLDLDTKMKTLWDGAADTATILASLQESVGTLQTDVTTLEGVVSGHTSTITTINESLVLINTALNTLNTQVVNKFDSVGIADPYDATHGTYDVGDVVTYNGQRYVCTTAVTAAEPFDVSKWSAEDVQTVIDQIKNDLTNNKFGTAQNITSSATVPKTNAFTFNSDGYLKVEVSSTGGDYVTATLTDEDGNDGPTIRLNAVSGGQYTYNSLFVRKGMKVYIPSGYGTYSATFNPLA